MPTSDGEVEKPTAPVCRLIPRTPTTTTNRRYIHYDGRHELNSGDDFVPSPVMERVLIIDFVALNRKQMCGDSSFQTESTSSEHYGSDMPNYHWT